MNPFSLPYLQPLPVRTPMTPRRSWRTPGFRRSHLLLARSVGEAAEPPSTGPDEAVAGLLGERVDELLKREENRPLLERLEEASRRVETARAALAEIEKQEAEAIVSKQLVLQLQNRESEVFPIVAHHFLVYSMSYAESKARMGTAVSKDSME